MLSCSLTNWTHLGLKVRILEPPVVHFANQMVNNVQRGVKVGKSLPQ